MNTHGLIWLNLLVGNTFRLDYINSFIFFVVIAFLNFNRYDMCSFGANYINFILKLNPYTIRRSDRIVSPNIIELPKSKELKDFCLCCFPLYGALKFS